MKERIRRWLYVRAMMKAIDAARSSVWIDGTVESKAYGLRVIRRFESVNNIAFDPFNREHVEMVTGWAWNEALLWRLSLIAEQG